MDDHFNTELTTEQQLSWTNSCIHWLRRYDLSVPTRRKRDRHQSPLILCGHGLSIRVDKGTLLIRDGNTHYPADERTRR